MNKMTVKSRALPGFTLIEVLAAVLIISLAIAAIFVALPSAADTVSLAEKRSQALKIAQMVSEDVKLSIDSHKSQFYNGERVRISTEAFGIEMKAGEVFGARLFGVTSSGVLKAASEKSNSNDFDVEVQVLPKESFDGNFKNYHIRAIVSWPASRDKKPGKYKGSREYFILASPITQ